MERTSPTLWYTTDPVMEQLVQKIPAPESLVQDDLYLSLLRSVISQQLSTQAARSIYTRFCGLFDESYPHATQVLRLETDHLRKAGLSAQKAGYIRNIADFHLKSPISTPHLLSMTDEDVITHLTQIKGVGRWTVQMLLMFPMNRPDIFPIDDLGIRQAMIQFYGVTETGKELHKRLHAIAEHWRPHRTIACKYLWKARDSGLPLALP